MFLLCSLHRLTSWWVEAVDYWFLYSLRHTAAAPSVSSPSARRSPWGIIHEWRTRNVENLLPYSPLSRVYDLRVTFAHLIWVPQRGHNLWMVPWESRCGWAGPGRRQFGRWGRRSPETLFEIFIRWLVPLETANTLVLICSCCLFFNMAH